MAPARLIEYLAGRTRPSVDDIVHALPDSLANVGAGGAVEQSLIGFRVLHNGLGLAVDGQDHRPLAFLHLLEQFPRFPPEICQRLNVLRNVEHGHSLCEHSTYSSSANHSDSSGLARSLALSFSRVAAARRIPVLPDVLQRNSGFLARARHARRNDRKIRPSGRPCHYLVQDSIGRWGRRSTDGPNPK